MHALVEIRPIKGISPDRGNKANRTIQMALQTVGGNGMQTYSEIVKGEKTTETDDKSFWKIDDPRVNFSDLFNAPIKTCASVSV